MSALVLDTHSVVWWLEGNPKLPANLREVFADDDNDLHLPAIVAAELIDLAIKGRSNLKLDNLLKVLREDSRFIIYDFTAAMSLSTAQFAMLPDIHDRLIVATTRHLVTSGVAAVLITRDRKILESGLVPVRWD